MSKREKIIILTNVLVPITIGSMIYIILSPDVYFVNILDKLMKINRAVVNNNFFIVFIRNYFLDMLWGYSLVFALAFIYGKDINLRKIIIIAFSFSISIELLQLTPIIRGTFDIYDIVLELIAELCALIILRKLLNRRNL